MRVVGSDEQIATAERQCARRHRARIDQAPQHAHERGFCRALFANQREYRIGAAGPQSGKQVRDDEREIVGADIEERPQPVDRDAGFRKRQWLHSGAASESHWWALHDRPACRRDAHGMPIRIGEIDICQSAFKFDPVSASNFDPFERRVLAVALASSELAGVAETWRARAA